ncbi:DNA cytosine methyltransferase [Peptococcus simiae]|uniref:DNA cytosine methyltransferase n=1 Tax=Peptococcus simiae TaxID=1643805 RepID=UPI003981916D
MNTEIIDLFCGAGGLTHGLEQAGLNVILGIDNEETCRFAYEANNSSIFLNSDITEISASEVDRYFSDKAIRILVGCAPCQPFSNYSNRYRKDGHKDNKWSLLSYFERLVTQIQPEIVSLENVPSLRNEEIFKNFIKSLAKMGYHTTWKIVNCLDYGIPQTRSRLVLLASKLGPIKLLPPTHTPENYCTVKTAIGHLPPLKDGEVDKIDPLHQSCKLSPINKKRIRQSLPGGTWRDWDEALQLKCHKKSTGKTFPSVYGRMEWDKPSPTITTQFFGYGNGRFGHPEQNRALSLREGAIIQSFPDDYKFIDPNRPLSKRQIATQIGNAVPVILGEVIGKSILQHLNRGNDDGAFRREN